MTKNLTVNTLLKKLQKLKDKGFGKYPVTYMYDENGLTVRDVIRYIEVAEEYDGKEIHMWQ